MGRVRRARLLHDAAIAGQLTTDLSVTDSSTGQVVGDVFTPISGPALGTVVVVHGWGGQRADLTQFAVALAERGVVVCNVAMRVPGDDATVGAAVVRVHRAITEVYRRTQLPVTVVGWSDGALVAATACLGLSGVQPAVFVGLGGFYGWPVDKSVDAAPVGQALVGAVPPDLVNADTITMFEGPPDQTPTNWAAGNPFQLLRRHGPTRWELVVGANDPSRLHTQRFAAALRANGHHQIVRTVEDCDVHGLVIPRYSPGAAVCDHVASIAGHTAPDQRFGTNTYGDADRPASTAPRAVDANVLEMIGQPIAERRPRLQAVLRRRMVSSVVGINGTVADHLDPASVDPATPCAVLLVGSDGRVGLGRRQRSISEVGTGERADTILLCVFEPATNAVVIITIPRDIGVDLSTVGYQRIGWALDYGGAAMTVDAVRGLTGLPVHHYVGLDFSAFAAAVNAFGGVDVRIESPMRDRRSGLMLPRGKQHIDGRQALAMVRARHQDVLRSGRYATVSIGDEVRRQRSRAVIDGVATSAARGVGVRTGARLASGLRGHVAIDPALASMSGARIRALIACRAVEFAELPTTPARPVSELRSPFPPFYNNGAKYTTVDQSRVDAVLARPRRLLGQIPSGGHGGGCGAEYSRAQE